MKKEVIVSNQYIIRKIEKFGVRYDEQGSIAKALKGASKQGEPEFVM